MLCFLTSGKNALTRVILLDEMTKKKAIACVIAQLSTDLQSSKLPFEEDLEEGANKKEDSQVGRAALYRRFLKYS